jgi:hypothetical protein
MDIKEAVAKAKAFVAETFADEDPSNLGLEELEFDDEEKTWNITIGFSRPWQDPTLNPSIVSLLGAGSLANLRRLQRSYKVVRIKEDGTVLSLKNRVMTDAA